MPATTTQATPQQLNQMARNAIKRNAIKRIMQIYSQTVTPSTSPNLVLSINPQNVGLGLGFFVEVKATITNGATATITPTDFNAANIFSQISLTDYQNTVRIQTSGRHLAMLNSITRKRPFASALTGSAADDPITFGANWTLLQATSSIAASGTGTLRMMYWVPLAYNDVDLRGAIYMNVTSANMNLQLAFNQVISVASGDTTNAIYTGASDATMTSATVTVYQVYYDQLPLQSNHKPFLPLIDLSTLYQMVETTSANGIVVSSDYPIQFANLRDFVSEVCFVNNGDTSSGHGGRNVGSDLNYIGLQTANASWIFKNDPLLQVLKLRQVLGTDLPYGGYYISHRDKVISLSQYGNMQLVFNFSSVGTDITPYILVGYEYFSFANTVLQAGSLAAS